MAIRGTKTEHGCACRVPLDEAPVPVFGSSAPLLAWLADRGIEVRNDYRGRLSIPVADAQRLWDESAEAAVRDVDQKQQLRSVVHNAELQRNRLAEAAYMSAMEVMGSGADAWTRAAIEAARAFEKSLPREVRSSLNALSLATAIAY